MLFPGEWAPQSAVLLAWPTARTDWADVLDAARACYLEIIAAAARFQKVVVCVDSPAEIPRIADQLPAEAPWPVHFVEVAYDDTWVRDSGPITLLDTDGRPRWLDFRFDAWGGKFPSEQDDRLVAQLAGWPGFAHLDVTRFDWVLEGGAIESDGRGTLLTTTRCLEIRWPGLGRAEMETRLAGALPIDRILWLDHGDLQGDDTDGHVDTIARFADPETIVYQACEDPDDIHYEPLAAMRRELEAFRTPTGNPYRLVPLPLPAPHHDADGNRLPAGYANFLILNGAVLMPTYRDADPASAMEALRSAFPEREVVGIDCTPLITQGGSLHCASMQLPVGVLGSS